MNKVLGAEDLFLKLDQLGISYKNFEHEPCFTVEESNQVCAHIKGAHSKNLFLKTKKKEFYLVSILEHKRLDIKEFAQSIDVKKLSFANDDYLMELLGVKPGSVTPYGLINDHERKINYYIDEDFLKAEFINFHPLQNDMTLQVTPKDFQKFMEDLGVQFQVISISLY